MYRHAITDPNPALSELAEFGPGRSTLPATAAEFDPALIEAPDMLVGLEHIG